MREIFQMGVMIILLIPCCVTDMKDRRVPTIWLLINTVVGIIADVCWKVEWGIILLGLVPGMFLFAVSFLTSGGIGRGDAYLYLSVGSILGFWGSLMVLFVSLVLASFYGGYLLKIKKKGRKYKIPFAPFTAGGYAILLLSSLFP